MAYPIQAQGPAVQANIEVNPGRIPINGRQADAVIEDLDKINKVIKDPDNTVIKIIKAFGKIVLGIVAMAMLGWTGIGAAAGAALAFDGIYDLVMAGIKYSKKEEVESKVHHPAKRHTFETTSDKFRILSHPNPQGFGQQQYQQYGYQPGVQMAQFPAHAGQLAGQAPQQGFQQPGALPNY